MSDYNRGSDSPGSERPLAFERRRQPSRGGPPPVTLIVSLALLAAVGGGVYYMYRNGTRAPGAPPAPIGAPVRDVKVAAPPQATPQDPAAGLSIYKENQGDNLAAPAFVPPPQQPSPRPGTETPPGAPTAAPVAGATSPPAPAAAPTAAPAPPAAPAAVASAAPARPAVPPPPPPPTPKPKLAKPTSIDKILAENADVKSPKKPLVKTPPKPTPPPPAAADAKSAPDGGGSAVIQIGAFSSKALADAGWNKAAASAPGGMAGKGKHVVPVTRADGSILYRTSITGFTSRAEAQALCARLRAAGGSCFVR